MMLVVLSIIIIVAAFNILSSLIMLVSAKTRDIAILRTMGASRTSMVKIFVLVGLSIGVIGTVLGLILAAVFLYYRQGVVNLIQLLTGQNLWDPSVRFLSELPARVSPGDVIGTVAMTLLLAFLPVAVAALVMGKVQDAVVENSESLLPRLVAAPLDGAMAAATYVLLVLVASRYFLARADRLKRPG